MLWQDFLALFAMFPGTAAGRPAAGRRCGPEPWDKRWEKHCRDRGYPGDRGETHRDERRYDVEAGAGPITVDAGSRGKVEVAGWDRSRIEIEAVIETWAPTDEEARELAQRIEIETGEKIAVREPEETAELDWRVLLRLRVPRASELDLAVENGTMTVSDVLGGIRFAGKNGAVDLDRVGGAIHGRSVNGRLSVALAEDSREDAGIDVETTNGAIEISLPTGRGGKLDAATRNGHLRIDLPFEAAKRSRRHAVGSLGEGDAEIRACTVNGGIHVGLSS